MQQPSPVVEAGADTGVGIAPPLADAGNPGGAVPDASMLRPDTGVLLPPFDSGVMMPPVDAGRDAGNTVSDAGDAGASGDAGGACPTYENFGRMFMSRYCISCHMGAAAPRMVRLDTLAGVVAEKAAIQREAVTSMAMPASGPTPSAAERQKLGQWLNCGPM